jgi:hypothetical protein
MPTRPPIDPNAEFTVVHQVDGNYLQTDDPSGPWLGQVVQIWFGDLKNYPKGRTWIFVQKPDGSYLIRTAEPDRSGTNEPLYLEAAANTSQDVEYGLVTQQQRKKDDVRTQDEDDRQSWLLQPFTDDINTYAFVSKKFPDFALGTPHGDVGDLPAVLRPTYGYPTMHYYWRLSPPPA